MRIPLLISLLLTVFVSAGLRAQTMDSHIPVPPFIEANSWILVDFSTGDVLASEGADTRAEPASLTKLMTTYVIFKALKNGDLKLEQGAFVSEKAWKMPGSRMFLEPGKAATIEQVLNGLIVQSGNDAGVALAENLAGSEQAFVALMNRYAKQLGLKNTHYTNATGLPENNHYTSARDVALLSHVLIEQFPVLYERFSIRSYTYNNIKQSNRNRLLWMSQGVDGLKTGHTQTAGYCLAASAKRGDRRLISVVMGARSESVREKEALALLNFGFLAYDAVRYYKAGEVVAKLSVFKGDRDTVMAGFDKNFTLSLPKGLVKNLQLRLQSREPLTAPVQQGQQVGTLRLMLKNGETWGEYPVVALHSVPAGNFFKQLWDGLLLWFR